jgi:hypothetical protein
MANVKIIIDLLLDLLYKELLLNGYSLAGYTIKSLGENAWFSSKHVNIAPSNLMQF